MYDKCPAPMGGLEPKGTTESERVLSNFDYKIEQLDKITSTLVANVTALGGFELLKGNTSDSQKAPQGGNFVSELDIRLDRLQRLIEGLDAVRINLGRIV